MGEELTPNAIEIDRPIGNGMRTRRAELGIGRDRLSELLGVYPETIDQFETGARHVSVSRLFDCGQVDCGQAF